MSASLSSLAKSGFRIIKHSVRYARQPKTWLTTLAGVGAMEAFFYLAPRAGLPRVDFATPNGTLFLAPGKKAVILGEFMFYLGGVGWVSLFHSLQPKIKGSPDVQAIKFGTMIYLFSSLVVFPASGLTNPYIRKGIFKKPGLFGFGLNGWKTAVSNLIGHMIFSQIIKTRLKP